VTVEPAAQVSIAGDDVSAIAAGYDSHLNNGSISGIATITAGGNDSRGVEVKAGSSIFNYGIIDASGAGGTGVEVEAEAESENHTVGIYSVYNGNVGIITGGSGSGAAVRLGDPGLDHGSLVPLELYNNNSIAATGDGSAVVGSGGADTVTNSTTGTITGPVFLWGGNDDFFNAGAITGDVSLGNGADVFKNTPKGTITGGVSLGDGDDTFIMGGFGGEIGTIGGVIDGGSGADTFELVSGPGTLDVSTIHSSFETVAIGNDEGLGGWYLFGSFTGDLEVRDGFVSMDDDVDLTGNLTQVDGTELGVFFDSVGAIGILHVAGDVDIGEGTTLTLLLEDSEVAPPIGTYSILTWTGSRNGEFEFENVDLGELLDAWAEYDDDAGVLQVVVPEPSAAISLAAAICTLAWLCRAPERNRRWRELHEIRTGRAV
jgi:hypothetical protein